MVRAKQHAQAVNAFKQAQQISPKIAQYLYTYALALDSFNKSKQGLTLLLKQRNHFKHNQMIKGSGLYLAKKLQDGEAFQVFNYN